MKKTAQPLRKCLATGQSLPKAELLRFVKGPDAQVWFDVSGKAPGRGAYTCPTRAAVQKAMLKKGLSKYLEAQVPENLEGQIAHLLREKALQTLGLAKKAGKVAIGLEEAQKAHKKRLLVGCVLAKDAGENAQVKTASFQRDRCVIFTKEELEKVLGVPNTSVVGLTDDKIWHTLQRAEQFLKQ